MPQFRRASSAGGPFQYIRLVLRLRGPFALGAVAFATLGLAAGFVGLVGAHSATHPLAALCIVAFGFSILRRKRYGRSALWCQVALAGVIVICAARMMDAVLAGSTGAPLSALFGPVAGFGGRFNLEVAIAMGAFSAAALMRQGSGRWGSVAFIAGLFVVFNTVIGLSLGVAFFNAKVGVLTLLGLGCAGLAMMSVYIHRPVVRAAFLLGDVGSQTRVMAAAVVLIPWGAGVLLDQFRPSGGLAAIEVGMMSGVIGLMLVLLLCTSARHEGSVAARRRVEREIAMRSRTDVLTGALNRFGITEVIEGAWVEFKSTGAHVGIILVDIEYFRRVDATFGQDDGEVVLARVAATLQPQLRTSDSLGRWGADEFLVLLKVKNPADVMIVANRLRAALMEAGNPFLSGLTMEPSGMDVPLGMSDMRDGDEAATQAISRADDDLHRAKTISAMVKDAQMTDGGVTGSADGTADLADEGATNDKSVRSAA